MQTAAIVPGTRIADFTGKRFGDLLVLEYAGAHRLPYGLRHFWAAQCNCGHVWTVAHGALRSGNTLRCGSCRSRRTAQTRRERLLPRGRGIRLRRRKSLCQRLRHAHRFHGHSDTAEYDVWFAVLQRCKNPTDSGYPNYGGRGIRVCLRWQLSFANFLDDMGPRPSDRHSIDRIDNNGPYSPQNCRWATRQEQDANRRYTGSGPPRIFTVNGSTGNMSQWARWIGISRERVRQRLLKYPPEVALTLPRGHSGSTQHNNSRGTRITP